MAKLTAAQFAQQIKTKHPEYNDIPDAELTQKIVAKYPQYSDMVESGPAPNYLSPENLARVKAMNANPLQDEVKNQRLGNVPLQFTHNLTKFLPGVGGAVGGTLGATAGVLTGPGAIATGIGGAALGGSAGESARQLIDRSLGFETPQTSGDAAKEIAIEGAKQGAYELGGKALGIAGKKAGVGLANIAASPGKRLLKSLPEGVQNLGKTIMENSTGVRPSTITNQLGEGITKADTGLNQVLSNADQQGVKIPLSPARMEAAGEMGSALRKNSPEYIQDVRKVQDQLAYKYGEDGKPVMQASAPATKQGAGFHPVQVNASPKMSPVQLPESVPPTQARALRQGLDLTIENWNPEAQGAIAPLQERVRGQIAGGIHSAVPESAGLDKAMTNLKPAKDAMWNVSYNPSIAKSLFNRIGRPTGALVGAGLGAAEGKREYGTPGMIAGGLAGLAVPEMVASPTGQMIMARTLHSDVLPKVITNASRLIDASDVKKKE
jgi:hypothetical protein